MSKKIEGIGLGLRAQHYQKFLAQKQPVQWLEILADNYLNTSGIPLQKLLTITKDYPTALHCVGMSLGSVDPINWEYCQTVKELADQLQPAYISDHLCWSSLNQNYSHYLLPLPFTEETIQHTASRIRQIQDFIGYPLLIENISTYVQSPDNEMDEITFLNRVAEKANCGILLDINNIYVNTHNHGADPYVMLDQVDAARVGQYHLAGHTHQGKLLIDTHGAHVPDIVWELYQHALKKIGPKPACIEWDTDIPDLSVLLTECQKAEHYHQQTLNLKT